MRSFVLVYAFLASAFAHAEPRIEILGGNCSYTPVGNYVWHNDYYPYSLDMSSGCSFIGMSDMRWAYKGAKLGYRIGFADLGVAKVDAVFPMVDAEQPLHPDGSACNGLTWSGCLGRGYGEQKARGITLGYVAEWSLKSWTLGLEAGAFLYEGSWEVRVYPEGPSVGKFRPASFDWEGYQISPYGGATLQYGYLMAMARFYTSIKAAEHGCGGCSGVASGMASQYLLGVQIPF